MAEFPAPLRASLASSRPSFLVSRVEALLTEIRLSLEAVIGSVSEKEPPSYRQKAGILSLDFFQRSGFDSIPGSGFFLNIGDASVRLGASNASSSKARAKIIQTAQKLALGRA